MKRLPAIAAWLLLLVPALVLAGLASRLLKHEGERLATAKTDTARYRAEAIVENIDLTVTEVKDGLGRSLQDLDTGRLEEQLISWQRSNPLIRNVFLWAPPDRLVVPRRERPANDEDAEFVERYRALFDGNVAWAAPADAPEPVQALAVYQQSSSRQQVRRQMEVNAPAQGGWPGSEVSDPEWLAWFWQNRIHLLGWVEVPDTGVRYGVEVETMAVLSSILGAFPASASEGEVYALIGGQGEVLHQVGSGEIEEDTPHLPMMPVGRALPHWQVAVYYPGGMPGRADSRAFVLVSKLLIGVFVAAILFGGSLLLWQAHLNLREAQQKTSFVSNVSHELKTPLTTIRMYAELLGEGRIKDVQKKRRYLDVIVAESQRLTRLVNNVLDFSRLEQGKKTYSVERLDLVSELRHVVGMQAVRLQEAGMRLEDRLPAMPVMARTDRDAVEQAVLNLIDNAIKYAADGGEVTVEVDDSPAHAFVRVMDRGPGVPASHRDRIFDQFHRVDQSLTARQAGSGLGLSITRRLLRDVGGDLTYVARDGGGACFEISLPNA